jgi:hypothetical protein
MMFSDMVADLNREILPDPVLLAKRFDIAITKKLGVVQLPPAFWMQDPKINPRSDYLFWAALLTLDRKRIELALSVLAVETAETCRSSGRQSRELTEQRGRDLIDRLLQKIRESDKREEFEHELQQVLPPRLTG